ncbi:hypothetical protein BCU70_00695 [Vibrio sp. 10N.286.49.C2]|uniref:hypothetical protein n=1 Tax=unclassified Vibrio TaxID=2614977 RepID=UPI000C814DFF|nr:MULTISPECIES: hypothetical protein [unclassified Vibrio]PMH43413.1 hypothetical protein BCU70_00695 [Vibrio sp. 10N.286.49.C2]PMH57065.1 hypothetical protein BCU66_06085 [Vibrio sp. 10N.286.49.B1]PMH78545.1 hypothetical protein BCU58_08930 [Vibrio sp. 10N.286.48.B7]
MNSLYFQLFWREKHGVMLEVNGVPDLPKRLEDEFTQWINNRKKIMSFEVNLQSWVKVDEDGSSTHIELKPNGTLTEKDLFSEKSLVGQWKVVDGVLLMRVADNATVVEYQVVGNRSHNIHCGVVHIDGVVNNYCKFVQVKNSQ